MRQPEPGLLDQEADVEVAERAVAQGPEAAALVGRDEPGREAGRAGPNAISLAEIRVAQYWPLRPITTGIVRARITRSVIRDQLST